MQAGKGVVIADGKLLIMPAAMVAGFAWPSTSALFGVRLWPQYHISGASSGLQADYNTIMTDFDGGKISNDEFTDAYVGTFSSLSR